MSNTITLTPVNGEPRVYDIHLAERLGFERPADIRKLIKRNEAKLNKFNHIATVILGMAQNGKFPNST